MLRRTGTAALFVLLFSGTSHARHREIPLSFEASSCFNVDLTGYPVISFHGPDVLDVEPFGPTLVDWTITVRATESGIEFVEGTFAFHVRNKQLVGEYVGFELDPLTGAYALDWKFTGGTGPFRKFRGTGRTDGVVDLTTYCAEYAFEGEIERRHPRHRWWWWRW